MGNDERSPRLVEQAPLGPSERISNSVRPSKRNRLDHILNAGYLWGFADLNGDGTLWVFDKKKRSWSARGVAHIAAEKGFYDYSPDGTPDATADQAFKELEDRFPPVRDRILREGYSSWVNYKNFLLRFSWMLGVRNRLFRKEHNVWSRKAVTQLSNADPQRARELAKNWAITDMRTQIKQGPAWFSDFDWTLRFTEDPNDPVITSDVPALVKGKAPELAKAVSDPKTLIFAPLCWQMCLVGSPSKFTEQTDRFHPNDLRRLRALFAKYADEFLVSPTKLRIEDESLNIQIGF